MLNSMVRMRSGVRNRRESVHEWGELTTSAPRLLPGPTLLTRVRQSFYVWCASNGRGKDTVTALRHRSCGEIASVFGAPNFGSSAQPPSFDLWERVHLHSTTP
jgi:hypothetical protein